MVGSRLNHQNESGDINVSDMDSIAWTRSKLVRFKKVYAEANEMDFLFEGHEFHYDYATYLIEYLQEELS